MTNNKDRELESQGQRDRENGDKQNIRTTKVILIFEFVIIFEVVFIFEAV